MPDTKPQAGAMFPALLKYWRSARGLSQLDLALAAEVSARHISFLETGRSQPSRDMVMRLGATLQLHLRGQNDMLTAAGFDEAFSEPSLDEFTTGPVGAAIQQMFRQHEPFPMVVMDRSYQVRKANKGAERLIAAIVREPNALTFPVNALHLVFDPRLARSFIRDWDTVARTLLSRLCRESLLRPQDQTIRQLIAEIMKFPGVPSEWQIPDFSALSEPTFTLGISRDALELTFLTTLTTFTAPQNVTLEELTIESYFPLDDATAEGCRRLSQTGERSADVEPGS